MLIYQLLTFPTDREFDITQIFRDYGTSRPSNRQLSYMRQVLRDRGFFKVRVHNRKEYWAHESRRTKEDLEKLCLYSVNSFAAKFFPSLIPRTRDEIWQMEKIMRSRGLAPRGNPGPNEYWSYTEKRRLWLPVKNAKPQTPRKAKYPRGVFTTLDFLQTNNMRRYPENIKWAKEHLTARAKRINPHRWVKPDARGTIPAFVSNDWRLPGRSFTTYEFQLLNNARHPTNEQWQSAVAFLEQSGYTYDPQWKRWIQK